MPSNDQRRKAAKAKLERQLANRAARARKRRTIGVVSTVVGVVVVVGVVYLLVNIGSGDDSTPAAEPTAAADAPTGVPTTTLAPQKRATALPAKATCAYPAEGTPAKPNTAPPTADIPAEGTQGATIKFGDKEVPVTLDRALAPCTVNSFTSLAKQGYFDGTACHRLTTSASLQVLQCGDPTGTGGGGPGYKFNDETFPEAKYGRGVLAMANSGANTNGSQFFMVYGAAELPPNYTVFGTISEDGLKVIDEIAAKGTQSGSGDGKPVNDATISSVAVA
ncbi:peptidylprolyl isomerase [Actinokineospora bangkokensis]|uniref:Peptidyl-prolyl cis-trans isomerase n=1 Tax=Actinokineospora bangkokensis TaxID=1193682 RepID=A0A1Q9LS92_9PSEU|nr:peptidylprolyl isomerase [Actinokineospora bangkokensis]OLR94880.1 peptidylprolyl isomerase [Actinokineospora bangkokensis]